MSNDTNKPLLSDAWDEIDQLKAEVTALKEQRNILIRAIFAYVMAVATQLKTTLLHTTTCSKHWRAKEVRNE